jgi:23S rRNA pseudouridine2605 synthase
MTPKRPRTEVGRGERRSPPEAVPSERRSQPEAAPSEPAEPSPEVRFERVGAGGERLQKVLARAGIASRRAAEALIVAGRVRVNGRVETELGVRVTRQDRVELDGKRLVAEPLVYVVLHKPRGVVCTLKDPEGRPTVGDHLRGVAARVVPVGRLDFHTSGALICTNDGELLERLAHPRHHAPKEYVAKVKGIVDEKGLERLADQIVIDGRPTRPAEVRLLRVEGDKTWITVRLREGKNRQVRRLGEHAGLPVMRLARVSHAGITIDDLRPGEWRHLTLDELKSMQREFGVPRRVRPPDLERSPPPQLERFGPVRRERTASPRGREERGARPYGDGPPRGRDERGARPNREGPPRGRVERGARPYGGLPPRGREERGASPYGKGKASPRGREERAARPSRGGPARGREERATRPSPRGREEQGARPSRGGPPRGREERAARSFGNAPARERTARPNREGPPRPHDERAARPARSRDERPQRGARPPRRR